jgi:RsiW-degrading membrane proteinase PrsW (M82 family)
MLIAFGLGAYSGIIAATYNAQYVGFFMPLYFAQPTLFIIIAISVIVPIVEEPTKPLGLYLLKLTKAKINPADWATAGAFAGFGFGLFENVVYTILALGHGASVALTLLVIRTLLSLPTHMITTSLAGFGVGLWAKRGELGSFIKFIILAIAIHSLYNLSIFWAGGGF